MRLGTQLVFGPAAVPAMFPLVSQTVFSESQES